MKKIILLSLVCVSLKINAQTNLAMLYSSAGMEYGKASAVDASNNYINYSQYLAEQIDKSMSYVDYLSENLYLAKSNSISYSEYLSEKINH